MENQNLNYQDVLALLEQRQTSRRAEIAKALESFISTDDLAPAFQAFSQNSSYNDNTYMLLRGLDGNQRAFYEETINNINAGVGRTVFINNNPCIIEEVIQNPADKYDFSLKVANSDGTETQQPLINFYFPPDDAHLKAAMDTYHQKQEAVRMKGVNSLLSTVNSHRSKRSQEINNDLNGNARNISQHESALQKLQTDRKILLSTKTALEKSDEGQLDLELIMGRIEELKKHVAIEDAYLAKSGNIIIFTKMLHAVNPQTNKSRRNNVGKFTISLGYSGSHFLYISNRSYSYADPEEYDEDDGDAPDYNDHPNISSTSVCLGDDQVLVKSMFNAFDLFMLVDYLIQFLTLFPHDAGSPYVDHMHWLEHKHELKQEDTEFIEDKLVLTKGEVHDK